MRSTITTSSHKASEWYQNFGRNSDSNYMYTLITMHTSTQAQAVSQTEPKKRGRT